MTNGYNLVMNKKIFLIIFILTFTGCTTKEIYNMGKAIVTLSPSQAVKTIAHSKDFKICNSSQCFKKEH